MMADTDSIQTWLDDEPLSKPPFSDIRDLLHENKRLRAGLQRAARGLEKLGADEDDISDAYESLEQKP